MCFCDLTSIYSLYDRGFQFISLFWSNSSHLNLLFQNLRVLGNTEHLRIYF